MTHFWTSPGRRRASLLLGMAAALLAGARPAHADGSLIATRFVATGGSVTVRYLGSSAAHFSTMQWFRLPRAKGGALAAMDAEGGGVEDLFHSRDGWNQAGDAVQGSASGSTMTLGGGYWFAPGEAVLLGLLVRVESNEPVLERLGLMSASEERMPAVYTYFSGAGAFNADGVMHLRVHRQEASFTYSAGWEDVYSGGDGDYNDVMFEISGITVTPEPVSLSLMATGLAGLAGAALRRRRRRDGDEEDLSARPA